METTGDRGRTRARRLARWGLGCGAVVACALATPAWAIGTGGQPPRAEGRARVLRPVRQTFVSSSPARHQALPSDSSSLDRPVAPATRRPTQPHPSGLIGFRSHEQRLREPYHPFCTIDATRGRKLSAARTSRALVAEAHIAAPAAVFHDANAPPRRPSFLAASRA